MKVSTALLTITGLDSAAELANGLGITVQAITGWDRKGKLPPLRALQIAQRYGVSVDHLIPLTLH